jgi:hypothetical protein
MYYFKIIHKERTQVAEAGLSGACTHVFSYKLEFMAEWTSHLIIGQRPTSRLVLLGLLSLYLINCYLLFHIIKEFRDKMAFYSTFCY